ncbi:viral A-type inclusion protein, putative [Trichomonas vaginalis G3]|uniref:Viral A-type inclusion protein, putative n=1 Tax=Trichomonas vaginalis (strain ATCC PRA-98 / G3) TaxID=412133 RepID=A2EET7_TRIV3|nr:hypothetical protein TVAGG3_0061240 [Trichomonas vaginalis G3]EAY08803.1 viral A-type inclusion protein, putative [Trichomonas vaginalis G3]KAI5542023.1 hypothetical protein TVAGG3_0061240 [Trichomonas vaginalis G3]|eukprot:XP_001321026.1 viral A-type inclusion protein [Trichomonas vaginalis G3]
MSYYSPKLRKSPQSTEINPTISTTSSIKNDSAKFLTPNRTNSRHHDQYSEEYSKELSKMHKQISILGEENQRLNLELDNARNQNEAYKNQAENKIQALQSTNEQLNTELRQNKNLYNSVTLENEKLKTELDEIRDSISKSEVNSPSYSFKRDSPPSLNKIHNLEDMNRKLTATIVSLRKELSIATSNNELSTQYNELKSTFSPKSPKAANSTIEQLSLQIQKQKEYINASNNHIKNLTQRITELESIQSLSESHDQISELKKQLNDSVELRESLLHEAKVVTDRQKQKLNDLTAENQKLHDENEDLRSKLQLSSQSVNEKMTKHITSNFGIDPAIEKEIQNKTKEISEMKFLILQLSDKLEASRKNEESLKQQLDEAQANFSASLQNATKTVRICQNELDSMRIQLQKTETMTVNARNNVEQMITSLKETYGLPSFLLDDEMTQIVKIPKLLDETFAGKDEIIAKLQAQIQKLNSDSNDAFSKQNELSLSVTSLQSVINDLQNDKNALTKEIQDLKLAQAKELQELQEKLNKSQIENENYKVTIKELQEKLVESQKLTENQKFDHENEKKITDQYLEKQRGEIETLQNSLKQYNDDQTKQQSKIQELNDTINDLRNKAAEKDTLISKLTKDLENQKSISSKTIENLQKQLDDNTSRLTTEISQINSKASSNEQTLMKNLKDLEGKLNDANKQIDQEKSKNTDFQRKMSELQNNFEKDKMKFQNEIDKLENMNHNIDDKVRSIQKENEKLKIENNELSNTIKSERDENHTRKSKLNDEINQLKQKLIDQKKESENQLNSELERIKSNTLQSFQTEKENSRKLARLLKDSYKDKENLQNNFDREKQEKDKLTNTVEDMKKVINKLENDLNLEKNKTYKMQVKMDMEQVSTEQLKQKLKDTESQSQDHIAKLKSKISKLKTNLLTLTNEKSRLTADAGKESLLQSMDQLQNSFAQVSAENDKLNTINDSLKHKIDELKEEQNSLKNNNKNLSQEISSLKDQVNSANSKIRNLTSENDKLKSDNSRLNNEVNEWKLQSQTSEVQSTIQVQAAKKAFEDIKTDKLFFENECKKLKEENAKLQKSIEETVPSTDYNTLLADYNEFVKKMNDSDKNVNEKIASKEKELNESKKYYDLKLSGNEKLISELQEDKDKKAEVIKNLQSKITGLQDQINSLTNSNSTMCSAAERDRAFKLVEQIEKENNELKLNLEKSEVINKDKKLLIDDLTKQMNDIRLERDRLSQNLFKAENNIKIKDSEISSKNDEISSLKSQIKDIMFKNDSNDKSNSKLIEKLQNEIQNLSKQNQKLLEEENSVKICYNKLESIPSTTNLSDRLHKFITILTDMFLSMKMKPLSFIPSYRQLSIFTSSAINIQEDKRLITKNERSIAAQILCEFSDVSTATGFSAKTAIESSLDSQLMMIKKSIEHLKKLLNDSQRKMKDMAEVVSSQHETVLMISKSPRNLELVKISQKNVEISKTSHCLNV